MGLFSPFKKKKKRKTKASTKKVRAPKMEGTAITYGQAFHFPFPAKEGSSDSAHIVGKRKFSDKTSVKSQSGAGRDSPFVAPTITPLAPISKNPSTVSVSPNLPLITQQVLNAPKETIVKIIRRTEDIDSSLQGSIAFPRRLKSDLAIAAASANAGATVVLPANKFTKESKKSDNLVGSILNDISKVAPNVEEVAISIPSSIKSKEEIREILEDAKKVDLTISLKSKRSESLESNLLKVSDLEASFNYNFFVEDEEDIVAQEDQDNDPLLVNKPIDTPRYVELRWNILSVTELLAGTEREAQLYKKERSLFASRRGVAGHSSNNFRDSVANKKKQQQLLQIDGIKRKIVDIHKPEVAFKKISNKAVFANSIATVLSTTANSNEIFSLPVTSIRQPGPQSGDEIVSEPSFNKVGSFFPGANKKQ